MVVAATPRPRFQSAVAPVRADDRVDRVEPLGTESCAESLRHVGHAEHARHDRRRELADFVHEQIRRPLASDRQHRVECRGQADLAEQTREHVCGQFLRLQCGPFGIAGAVSRVTLDAGQSGGGERHSCRGDRRPRIGAGRPPHRVALPRERLREGHERDDVPEPGRARDEDPHARLRDRARSRAPARGIAAVRRGAGNARRRPRARTSRSGSSSRATRGTPHRDPTRAARGTAW